LSKFLFQFFILFLSNW